MAKILLTGGSGFVGLNIAEALLRRGDEVVVFADRQPAEGVAAYLRDVGGTVGFVTEDVCDADAVARAAGGCDTLIHGAAISPGSRREGDAAATTVAINVTGTINAVSAAKAAGIERMLYLGSAAVYGASSASPGSLSEDETPARPESIYAISKFAAERIALRLGAQGRLDLRAVRIGSAFGPWEHDTGVRDTLSAIFQVTMAAMSGAGEVVLPRPGRRDWIYSRDVAEAILRILDREDPPSGVVNIGLGHEWAVSDWCRLLEGALGTRFRLAEPGEVPTIDYHGTIDRSPLDISRLSEEIGFQPTHHLDRAFADYIAWLQQQDPSRRRA